MLINTLSNLYFPIYPIQLALEIPSTAEWNSEKCSNSSYITYHNEVTIDNYISNENTYGIIIDYDISLIGIFGYKFIQFICLLYHKKNVKKEDMNIKQSCGRVFVVKPVDVVYVSSIALSFIGYGILSCFR